MTLIDYKKESKLSFSQLADLTTVPKTILFRICSRKGYPIKLADANLIVQNTDGKVSYEDLLVTQEVTA